MVTFDWKGAQHGPSSCPVCGSGGAKHRLIEITVERNLQRLLATDFIALLRCPACHACYCDPLRSIGYETADAEGLKYYIEQGAGVDVMLEPLSLVDGAADQAISRNRLRLRLCHGLRPPNARLGSARVRSRLHRCYR